MVESWGRSEDGSAPFSDLVGSWGKTCGQKMGQPGLKTGAPSSDRGLVRRWGRPVLRPGRSEDGAQHIHSNSIENIWSNIKAKFKAMRGSNETMIPFHLDKFIYRWNRKFDGDFVPLFFQNIERFYPLM